MIIVILTVLTLTILMTYKDDLIRLLRDEVDQLRKEYYKNDTKIKNLENQIKDKDIIIKLLKGKNKVLSQDAKDQINRDIENHFATNQ
jgi:hypothetical protein